MEVEDYPHSDVIDSLESIIDSMRAGEFGNYSSVYIASGLLITLKVTREDLIPAESVQEEVDEMP